MDELAVDELVDAEPTQLTSVTGALDAAERQFDTVGADDSQFVPRRKNGRLYGRGACDTKGSVAAMLAALCDIARSRQRPRACTLDALCA